MGGIGTLPMDYGQSLQVNNQSQNQMPIPNYSSAQSITSNPLLNYGQPELGQGGGTPLTMRSGGISRLGYQEGGMGMVEDQAMMQQPMEPQESQGIMDAMSQQQGMPQEGGQEQTALLTIVQLLIEQGIPPEQARELAMQILQAFNQGGAPAVEEFANQLEQQEGMQEPVMMANGGIMNYAQRQNYGLGSVFKSVGKIVKGAANAVKSIAKSPIGQIALAIAAPYAIGALAPGFATLGGSGFMGAALRAGISNLAIQGITTGKFNPKQALLAAVGGGVANQFFPQGVIPNVDPSTGLQTDSITGTITQPTVQLGGNLESNLFQNANVATPITTSITTPTTAVGTYPELKNLVSSTSPVVNVGATQPNIFERGITSLKEAGTNLMNNPIETIGKYASSAYQSAQENAIPLTTGFLGGSLLSQQPGETDDAYASRASRDPEVQKYITLYGGGSKLYSPEFYKATGAVDPFAGRTTFAATGGRIGYENGSMPMGEPRRNPEGIMELDYRKKGGFVPPIGIKEKADDIPAMLSNNEFVFTANAVRNAGGGDENLGAQRMYRLMKKLESGGRV
jgi:hypothetical protein